MRADVFAFFRGTCHLFYEDWPRASALNEAPPVWVCGDLHLENFGSYKGDNRLVYFDISDFDEAALAPCTWDLARLLTSILLSSAALGVKQADALALCKSFLDAYTVSLARGQARVTEQETAVGLVKELLIGLRQRRRKDFLNERTKLAGRQRRLRVDQKRTLKVAPEQKKKVKKVIKSWAAAQPDPGFFKLLDVAHRVAGTGSLGVERYVLLVAGKGSPDDNYLLDFKAQPGSALQPYLQLPQPPWESQAARVVAIQERVQGTPPALLAAVRFEDHDFVLRELQPYQDRVSLKQWDGRLSRLVKLLRTMGEITAWDQLRSGGRQGSAIADDLIAFAQARSWRRELLAYARTYCEQVEKDYREFVEALKKKSVNSKVRKSAS